MNMLPFNIPATSKLPLWLKSLPGGFPQSFSILFLTSAGNSLNQLEYCPLGIFATAFASSSSALDHRRSFVSPLIIVFINVWLFSGMYSNRYPCFFKSCKIFMTETEESSPKA